MNRSDYGKTTNGMGRREFLLKALASGGISWRYLRSPAGLLLAKAKFSQAHQNNTSNQSTKELVTSNVDFFVRNHFATPKISDEAWRLEIGGLVSKPVKLSYSDLLLMPSVRRPSTLECAGDESRAGVGTASWSGFPLGELLQQAGLKPGATTIVFYGADSGEGENVPPRTHFARAIPLEKAMEPATLLAYEMNGEPLPAEHGFPLRAVVPGWYGMDSVKWLTRIEVRDQPFKGYFQDEKYASLGAHGASRPLSFIQVNSKFLRPSEGEEIRVKTYRVEGIAWAGVRKIARVEVRVGGGAWQPVNLSASPAAMVWSQWSYEWQVPSSGRHALEVRATDEDGHCQPEVRDPDRKDPYELNTPHRVEVTVP